MKNVSIHNTGNAKMVAPRLLLLFMMGWFIINALQAASLGLDGDEAYYWMLSREMNWGYFDHPPMVALLINIGESIGHGVFFTRLGTVLITTLSIGVIYNALPDHLKNIKNYLWLFAATLILNVYSFITTPDAPLLFFSALFFYAYKKFLEKENFLNTLLIAIAIAGMFYSKYHGVLPVFFVLLSNLRLLLNKRFWLIVIIITALFIPHLYWQYLHDWPTVRFHLFERATKKYKIEYTTNYVLGQLLIWGPIISLLFYIHIRKINVQNKLVRAHLFNFCGILILFFLSSFRNNVQPHWTLVACTSYITLFLQLLYNGNATFKKTFFKLCYINTGFILLTRVLFIIPHSPFEKIKNYLPFFYGKQWADQIYIKSNGRPVLFTDSYADPSLYRFYHPDVITTGYNTKTYRKTHYSLNHSDTLMDGKDIYWMRQGNSQDKGTVPIASPYHAGELVPIHSFNAISGLRITALNLQPQLIADKPYHIHLKIENRSNDTIFNRNGSLSIEYSYSPLSYVVNDGTGSLPLGIPYILPGKAAYKTITLIAPKEPGKNRILFSFKNGILQGNFASSYYQILIRQK